MTITEAQADLRRAYVGGGPGAFVSGLLWFIAAWVEARHGTRTAFIALFFGGMLIFPLGLAASRLLFRRARESGDNPMGMVALESTIAMIGCLLAAWLILPLKPELAFPLAAVAVGTHYFVFKTAYGNRLYWLLAALVTGLGLGEVFEVTGLGGGMILAVGLVELLFGMVLTVRALKVAR
ncbi:DUF7010 family protein [Sphingomonas sp.]|uniref:DUF7010 family protein n=1 Tax=Sphingomonas sp. TaxID=28214 RepID=UPI00286A8FA5|nr:hypothetical protein [Sphingomonas sp.]